MSIAITSIEIEPDNGLVIRPRGASYEFIYRTATGIGWRTSDSALHANKPMKWNVVDFLKNVRASVYSEYGDVLVESTRTKWINIPEPIKVAMRAELQTSL